MDAELVKSRQGKVAQTCQKGREKETMRCSIEGLHVVPI